MAGVKQFIIAHIETGKTASTLETMMKILVPLGKTLIMADYTPEPEHSPVTKISTVTPALIQKIER